jgi:SAM-dependent methyltransferase
MHLDVLDLRSFYYRTGLGRAAQQRIRSHVRDFWPKVDGMTVVGFGFAVPVLRPFLGEAERLMALMPGQQGVMPWPPGERNISVLCEETLWPLEKDSVDRMIFMHGLDTSENPFALLEECYRTLKPEGRALLVVPNRSGLWTRNDKTPFGFGRPYSQGQLEAQIRNHDFVPERCIGALYQPPSAHKFWMRSSRVWERLGQRVSRGLAGGVLILEIRKQVPAPPRRGLADAVKKPLRVLDGIAQPSPKPV